MSLLKITLFLLLLVQSKQFFLDDICGKINGQRVYLEFEEKGTLVAKQEKTTNSSRCSVQFITCPACVVQLKFRFLNISRTCGKSAVLDGCSCDYVWIYEPFYEQKSGRQFCGRFLENNRTFLDYTSQTRNVVVSFLHSEKYGHAFTLDYTAKRNRVFLTGFPKFGNINNGSQVISTPFFPIFYPNDLCLEYVIHCESDKKCRISLIFSDYQIGDSSIIEFFDWNGERISVGSGNIFRPPVIESSGPSLVVRFYGNGYSNLGFKAVYSFILDDSQIRPNIDCGGYVSNLGGGITMMNMVSVGTKLYDCVWIIKPVGTYFHMKTHIYVKLEKFSDFAGNTELTIHQGITSEGPLIDIFRNFFNANEHKEHIVSTSEGFYIGFKGVFKADSKLAVVYAAFNYKDCYPGFDFPCRNFRCVSILLGCDGFNHCGDNSDELDCTEDSRDRRRQWPKTPNFLFSKVGYSDLTTATLVFILCSFGLIGFIFGMAAIFYRFSVKTRHRQIQDHIETIHAILEESTVNVEEEIIISDDPPGYEAPPDYEEILKFSIEDFRRCYRCNLKKRQSENVAGTSRASQTIPAIPNSPPPAYSTKLVDLQTKRRFFGLIRCFSDSEITNLSSDTVDNIKLGKFLKFSRRHNSLL